MKKTRRYCVTMTLIFSLSGTGHASRVGDVATGKIVSETDTVLTLQTKPCSSSPEAMMFSAPWKKRFVASKKCPNGQQYDEYEVEQKSQFSNSTAARAGDVADGSIDQQTDDSVTLNTTPCEAKEKAQFIVFDVPFKVRDSGQGTCPDGRKYHKSNVEQLSLAFSSPTSPSGHLAWQEHINWATANATADPGETNCPDLYAAAEPSCIMGGGRSCLMAKAIQAAKAGDCNYAVRLTLITQCHNPAAQQEIARAGPQAICSYLKTR
jgi:Zn ribbon nucleic-acid-binding protein